MADEAVRAFGEGGHVGELIDVGGIDGVGPQHDADGGFPGAAGPLFDGGVVPQTGQGGAFSAGLVTLWARPGGRRPSWPRSGRGTGEAIVPARPAAKAVLESVLRRDLEDAGGGLVVRALLAETVPAGAEAGGREPLDRSGLLGGGGEADTGHYVVACEGLGPTGAAPEVQADADEPEGLPG